MTPLPQMRGEARLACPGAEDALRLRRFLHDAGYHRDGLAERFGSAHAPSPYLRNAARMLYRAREGTPLDVLAELFFANVSVPAARLERALPRWFIDLAAATGMIVEAPGGFRATMLLVPYRDLLVASDSYAHLSSEDRFGHVLTLNPAAQYVADMTMREPVGETLDLGTGCGVQALLAASHSRHVTATDINSRAIAYTAFNARLNGIENIACVLGSVFAPVADRRFDLIVCNPPFIVAPRSEYVYRDGGGELDDFCFSLLREAPGYLAEGGILQMAFEWVRLADEADWRARVESRLDAAGCDVWLVCNYSDPPEAYAQTRLRERPFASDEDDRDEFARWMEYYGRHRVAAINGGTIVLRRRAGANWRRLEEVTARGDGPFGGQMRRTMAAFDFLATCGNEEALLGERFHLAPEARIEHVFGASPDGWKPDRLQLRLGRGLQRSFAIRPDLVPFLERLDGGTTLGSLASELAATTGAERRQVEAEVAAMAWRLVEHGFLVPAPKS